jgi:hypothetical protein
MVLVIVIVIVIMIVVMIVVVLVTRLDVDLAFVRDASHARAQRENHESSAKRDDGRAQRLVHDRSAATPVPWPRGAPASARAWSLDAAGTERSRPHARNHLTEASDGRRPRTPGDLRGVVFVGEHGDRADRSGADRGARIPGSADDDASGTDASAASGLDATGDDASDDVGPEDGAATIDGAMIDASTRDPTVVDASTRDPTVVDASTDARNGSATDASLRDASTHDASNGETSDAAAEFDAARGSRPHGPGEAMP